MDDGVFVSTRFKGVTRVCVLKAILQEKQP